jgi:tRNA threonylcarbamoyladenosine biosynthesis protein TsaE
LNTLLSHSLSDLPELAVELIEKAKKVRFIAFTGNLGAGKTTLIGEILKMLTNNDFNGSPTFSLVNEYIAKTGELIYHFDFYRLRNENEAFDIGWEDYLQKENAWIFVEWPEKIENLLPEHFLHVNIKQDNSGRLFEWKMF